MPATVSTLSPRDLKRLRRLAGASRSHRAAAALLILFGIGLFIVSGVISAGIGNRFAAEAETSFAQILEDDIANYEHRVLYPRAYVRALDHYMIAGLCFAMAIMILIGAVSAALVYGSQSRLARRVLAALNAREDAPDKP